MSKVTWGDINPDDEIMSLGTRYRVASIEHDPEGKLGPLISLIEQVDGLAVGQPVIGRPDSTTPVERVLDYQALVASSAPVPAPADAEKGPSAFVEAAREEVEAMNRASVSLPEGEVAAATAAPEEKTWLVTEATVPTTWSALAVGDVALVGDVEYRVTDRNGDEISMVPTSGGETFTGTPDPAGAVVKLVPVAPEPEPEPATPEPTIAPLDGVAFEVPAPADMPAPAGGGINTTAPSGVVTEVVAQRNLPAPGPDGWVDATWADVRTGDTVKTSAGIYAIIDRKPDGYTTMTTEGGEEVRGNPDHARGVQILAGTPADIAPSAIEAAVVSSQPAAATSDEEVLRQGLVHDLEALAQTCAAALAQLALGATRICDVEADQSPRLQVIVRPSVDDLEPLALAAHLMAFHGVFVPAHMDESTAEAARTTHNATRHAAGSPMRITHVHAESTR